MKGVIITMLISCPECELQVSDKAIACPHCGYPLKPEKISHTMARKRARLPNGFGQISKIKNRNLTNPYRAMITVGTNDLGRPIVKMLKPQAYFHTYNDAYAALVEYHKNPYDLDAETTVEQLHELWYNNYISTHKLPHGFHTYDAAWKYCESIYRLPVRELRPRHIKYCIEHGELFYKGVIHNPPPSTQLNIKNMFNMMLDYAVEYELVNRNIARAFKPPESALNELSDSKQEHIAFTDAELKLLWANRQIPDVDIILVQCYMGWRPQELGELLVANIFLEQNIIVGGMKTDAGKERIVPIHPCIKPIIEQMYATARSTGNTHLVLSSGVLKKTQQIPLEYGKYRRRFHAIMEQLGLNPEHKPHDPRKTFVTLAKKYKVDEWAIKRIVGHSIPDITEKIYTERSPQWLYEEICKIKK